MNLVILIYLASVAESVSKAFIIVGATGVMVIPIIMIVGCLLTCDQGLDVKTLDRAIGYMKRIFYISLFIWFVGNIIPNEKTIYLMMSEYATEQAIVKPHEQKLNNDVLNVAEKKPEDMKGD